MSTARMTSPRSRYCSYSSCIAGISSRQGWHQVAQKLMSTGLPLRSASRTVPPSAVGRLKSGAGLPSRAAGCAPLQAARARARRVLSIEYRVLSRAFTGRFPAQREYRVPSTAYRLAVSQDDSPVEVLRQAQEQAGDHHDADGDQENTADHL